MRCEFALRAVVVAIGALAWQEALPNPTGGKVAAGQGAITQSGSAMTVTQSSQNLSLNWESFSIAPSESVRFAQPNASAIALNRVLGSNASEIYGSLQANGQVFLINPNGVLFGPSAQVDVGGLAASTLNLSDSDFLAGKRTFSGSGGSVVNQGAINATNGYVALIGREASNQGTITARLGTVALAAGDQVTLDLSGDHLINVQVDKSALNALAQNQQLIQADGGKVIMITGAKDALLNTVVNNDGVIQARTLESHNGQIVLLGGMESGIAQVNGTLDASAPNGGDGGTIETSAAQVKVGDSAVVTTAAPTGNTGTWLIDPKDYTVAAKGSDITGAALSSNLGTSNVTIQSGDGKKNGSGDVNVNDTVNWSANTTLTMTASNNVNVNATIEADGTNAGIVINPNTANGGEAASGTGQFNLARDATVNLPNVSPTSTTALVIGGTPYTVINSLGSPGIFTTGTDLQGMENFPGGNFALGSNIDASATSGWNGGAGFTPVLSLGGKFEGLNHTINGLTINRPTTGFLGLFGVITGAVAHVGIIDATVTGINRIGALAGSNLGTVSYAYSTATVDGATFVGGLIGENLGSMSNTHSSGVTNGTSPVGGLVGFNQGEIIDSYAISRVDGTTSGGLVGENAGAVSNSYSTGTVTGNFNIGGGLVGVNDTTGTISRSYSTSVAGARGAAGGLVGDNLGSVSESYSTGAVDGRFNIGGLVGQNESTGTISNSYSTGAASGDAGIGGLVGFNQGTVIKSYSTGAVTGIPGVIGGLVGGNTGTVSNSFWDVQTSGLTTSAAGIGLTTKEMQTPATFIHAGWDRNVWLLRGNRYPQLRVFAQ